MSDDKKEAERHHHDPINYLRAVRGDEVQPVENLRRLDSDDEVYSVEQYHDYSLDGVTNNNNEGLATAVTAASLQDDDDRKQEASGNEPKQNTGEATPELKSSAFFPTPAARRAYRPQSYGSAPQPPARERPDPDSAWPYRETLSFTRSLVFYGAGEFARTLCLSQRQRV